MDNSDRNTLLVLFSVILVFIYALLVNLSVQKHEKQINDIIKLQGYEVKSDSVVFNRSGDFVLSFKTFMEDSYKVERKIGMDQYFKEKGE